LTIQPERYTISATQFWGNLKKEKMKKTVKKIVFVIVLLVIAFWFISSKVTEKQKLEIEKSIETKNIVSKGTQGNTQKEITSNNATVKKGINVVEGLTIVAGTTKCTQCGSQIKKGEKYYIANSKDMCSKCFNK
jgi:type II secretory pathway component PulF